MAIQKFDELNNRERYEEYYSVMDISEEQMLERIELAELLDDVFLFVFTYLNAQILASVSIELSAELLSDMCERRYVEALESYGIDLEKHPDIKEYVSRISTEMVESTLDKGKSKNVDIEERAISVAEQESNTIFNRVEFDDAVSNGKYTKKTWVTEQDSKVRSTHAKVDMETIPIDVAFEVGNSKMMFPKDDSMGADAREIVNCRCSIIYS